MNFGKWFTLLLVMASGLLSIINPAPYMTWTFIICCVLAVLAFAFSSPNKNRG